MEIIIQRFYGAGNYLAADSSANCLVFYGEMAAGLFIPHTDIMVGICNHRGRRFSCYFNHGELSKHQGGIGQPGEEFEIRIDRD